MTSDAPNEPRQHNERGFLLGMKYEANPTGPQMHIMRGDGSEKALCGAKPGPTSPGWEVVDASEPASCPRCIKREARQAVT